MSISTPTPPLLLTKRLNAFLHANQAVQLPTLLLTTSSGKLLAHASPQPVALLRTHATVAASLLAIHTSSSAAVPSALPGSRTPDVGGGSPADSDRGDGDDDDEEEEDGDVSEREREELVEARQARAVRRAARCIKPVTITVQLSAGTVIIRRLKCGLLFVAVGPSVHDHSSSDLSSSNTNANTNANTPSNNLTTSTASLTLAPHHENGDRDLTAGVGTATPSEAGSLVSNSNHTATSSDSAAAASVAAMRRHAAALSRWLDDKLGTLQVPEEGVGVD